MLVDDNMKDDEEAMINECLAMYQNLALPTTASILSGMYYILRDPKIRQTVLAESQHFFGKDLTSVKLAERIGNADLIFTDHCFMEAMRLDAPFRLDGINVAT